MSFIGFDLEYICEGIEPYYIRKAHSKNVDVVKSLHVDEDEDEVEDDAPFSPFSF